MLRLFVSILLITININAFIIRYKSGKNINLNYCKKLTDFDFDIIEEKKYAIISFNNKRARSLINEMEKNGIAVFLVDRIFFKDTEIVEMAKYYKIDTKKYNLKKDMLLFLDDDFIGNEFDAYTLIFTNPC
jgi:hypothetical protein